MKTVADKLFTKYLVKQGDRFINPKTVVIIQTRTGKHTWSTGEGTFFDGAHPDALLVEYTGDSNGTIAIGWNSIVNINCEVSSD